MFAEDVALDPSFWVMCPSRILFFAAPKSHTVNAVWLSVVRGIARPLTSRHAGARLHSPDLRAKRGMESFFWNSSANV